MTDFAPKCRAYCIREFMGPTNLGLDDLHRHVVEDRGATKNDPEYAEADAAVIDVAIHGFFHGDAQRVESFCTIEIRAEGLESVCFQHEIDHLDGILFIDRISRLKRGLYVKRRKKQILADEEDDVVDTRGSRL